MVKSMPRASAWSVGEELVRLADKLTIAFAMFSWSEVALSPSRTGLRIGPRSH